MIVGYLVCFKVRGDIMLKNPYEVLGVKPSMSESEVKSAYRKLVKKYHPDGSQGDRVKFEEVQKAWEELKSIGEKAFNRKVSTLTHKTLFTFRRS